MVIDQLRKRVSNIAMLIPRRILMALFFSFCFIVLAVNGGICEEDLSKGVVTALNCLNSGLPWQKLEDLRNALASQD